MHVRNDGKPFNAYRFDKWSASAQAAMSRSILNSIETPVRVSRFRVFLASFLMWFYSNILRKGR